jgi:HSP90 family molecular chaperone
VLELIQNADDNDYRPRLLSGRDARGEVPSLKFIINGGTIVVLNNEVGFSEKNVRAICDVGKSTKGAHRSGYIGQKGIGFKSVFRVTDKPEIHSNGFHIGFDASADPIGFILPHWIDNYQSDEDKM